MQGVTTSVAWPLSMARMRVYLLLPAPGKASLATARRHWAQKQESQPCRPLRCGLAVASPSAALPPGGSPLLASHSPGQWPVARNSAMREAMWQHSRRCFSRPQAHTLRLQRARHSSLHCRSLLQCVGLRSAAVLPAAATRSTATRRPLVAAVPRGLRGASVVPTAAATDLTYLEKVCPPNVRPVGSQAAELHTRSPHSVGALQSAPTGAASALA